MTINHCNVCGSKENIVGVASSGLGPISLLYCNDCAVRGAEPSWLVIGMLAMSETDLLSPEFMDQVTHHDGKYITVRELVEQYPQLIEEARNNMDKKIEEANNKLGHELSLYKNHPHAKWLDNQIKELSEIVSYLKKNNKPHTIVSYKISFAYAVKEFLTTGRNRNHLGRGQNPPCLFLKPPSPIAYRLLEELNNKDLRKFCYRVMEKMFTLRQMQEFMFSPYRRMNLVSVDVSHVVKPTSGTEAIVVLPTEHMS